MLVGNISWILVLLVICFYIAKASVQYFINKYPGEITYKFIPAIAAFVVFIYCAAILYFQVDAFMRNILLLILGVPLTAMSFIICIISMIIARLHHRKMHKTQTSKGEEE